MDTDKKTDRMLETMFRNVDEEWARINRLPPAEREAETRRVVDNSIRCIKSFLSA